MGGWARRVGGRAGRGARVAWVERLEVERRAKPTEARADAAVAAELDIGAARDQEPWDTSGWVGAVGGGWKKDTLGF